MKRTMLALALILWFVVSTLASIELINLTKGNAIPPDEALPTNQAYIRSNADIDPPTLPIQRVGNDKYVLVANIVTSTIDIQRQNMELYGNGAMAIQFRYLCMVKKIFWTNKKCPFVNLHPRRTNITIKNFKFENGPIPISARNCSHITIVDNSIINCAFVYFHSCTKCSIMDNVMTNNIYELYGYEVTQFDIKYNQIRGSSWHALILESLCNSSIIGNVFARNDDCGLCYLGSYNRVIGNEFLDNEQGILLYVANNEIHHITSSTISLRILLLNRLTFLMTEKKVTIGAATIKFNH